MGRKTLFEVLDTNLELQKELNYNPNYSNKIEQLGNKQNYSLTHFFLNEDS